MSYRGGSWYFYLGKCSEKKTQFLGCLREGFCGYFGRKRDGGKGLLGSEVIYILFSITSVLLLDYYLIKRIHIIYYIVTRI